MPYQSFDDQRGGSKSKEKLACIKLPADLTGKRVLDLGCNEGFFCIEAKRRGAAYVLGVDANRGVIEAARARAEAEKIDVNFFVGDFLSAPEGNFDFILMLSALHYAANPKAVLRRIHDLLSPNGVFILEYGVMDQGGRMMSRVLRSIDERFFPSMELLRDDWLDVFSVRQMGMSVPQAGDPIPRRIFHCVKRKPTVVFVCGPGSAGKSSVARQFSNPLMIQTDALITPRRNESRAFVSKEQTAIDEAMAKHSNHIGNAWTEVRTDPNVVRFFASVVGNMIALNASLKLIVVEGFMVNDLAPIIMADLKDEFVVWNLLPGLPPAQIVHAAVKPEDDFARNKNLRDPRSESPRAIEREFANPKKFSGRVRVNKKGMAVGWLCNTAEDIVAEVEILAEGRRVAVVKADRHNAKAKELGVSQNGLCGFAVNFETLEPGGQALPESAKFTFRAFGSDYELDGSPIVRAPRASDGDVPA